MSKHVRIPESRDDMKISNIGEKRLVPELCALFDESKINVLGFREDAAILDFKLGDRYLVVNVDKGVKPPGIFFGINDITDYGRWAVTAAISDVAVKGGQPIALMDVLFLPPEIHYYEVMELVKSINDYARTYGTSIVGGDTKSSKELTVTVICIGSALKTNIISRSGAKVGDIVTITGNLGNLWALIYSKIKKVEIPSYITTKLKPYLTHPRVPIETLLKVAELRGANSSMDISDGLAGTLWEIAEKSSVGIEIFTEKIPISKEVENIGKILNINPYKFSFDIGGEWHSLFTMPPNSFRSVRKEIKKINGELYPIGRVIEEEGVQLHVRGKIEKLPKFQDDSFRFVDFKLAVEVWDNLIKPL